MKFQYVAESLDYTQAKREVQEKHPEADITGQGQNAYGQYVFLVEVN